MTGLFTLARNGAMVAAATAVLALGAPAVATAHGKHHHHHHGHHHTTTAMGIITTIMTTITAAACAMVTCTGIMATCTAMGIGTGGATGTTIDVAQARHHSLTWL